jgi:hypothetical protein
MLAVGVFGRAQNEARKCVWTQTIVVVEQFCYPQVVRYKTLLPTKREIKKEDPL